MTGIDRSGAKRKSGHLVSLRPPLFDLAAFLLISVIAIGAPAATSPAWAIGLTVALAALDILGQMISRSDSSDGEDS